MTASCPTCGQPLTDLQARVAQAEADYDRALRHPRGDGLEEAQRRLVRLYAQMRREKEKAG